MAGLYIHTFLTLIGSVSVAEDGTGRVTSLYLPNQNLEPMDENETSVLSEAARQVNEYLSGRRTAFDLPLSIEGTDFQMDVLEAVEDIPYGDVRTYAEISEESGHPGAYRAVGTACARNPLPLIIPCHRVVPSSGGIGNYAGGSSLKRRLLELENPDISLRAQLADEPLDLVGVGVPDAGSPALEPCPSALLALVLEPRRCHRDELPVVDPIIIQEHLEHVVGNAHYGLIEWTGEEGGLLDELLAGLRLLVPLLIGHDIRIIHYLIVSGNESVLGGDDSEGYIAQLATPVIGGGI